MILSTILLLYDFVGNYQLWLTSIQTVNKNLNKINKINFVGPTFNELSRGIAGKIHRKYLCRKSENYYLAKRSFVILSLMVALFLASLNLPSSRVVQSNLESTYSIVEIIRESFHHGNPRFGYTAEIQFACNLFIHCVVHR